MNILAAQVNSQMELRQILHLHILASELRETILRIWNSILFKFKTFCFGKVTYFGV